jgi:hypothetical protein
VRVARAFHARLEAMPIPDELGPPPTGLTVTRHGPS